jgi:hypothetical protein
VKTIGEIKGKRGDHNDEQQGGIVHSANDSRSYPPWQVFTGF